LGEFDEAISVLRNHVGANPLREQPVGLLMTALYRAGRQPESLRVFRAYSDGLAELGLEPGPDLKAQELEILGHTAPRPRPAAGGLPPTPGNLVGRKGDLDRLADLVASSRLVTITGTGGVGKTRLAVEFARTAAAPDFDDVWGCDLAPLRDAAGISHHLARTVGVGVAGDQPLDAVIMYLHGRRGLLLIDNCEHLRAAAADVIEAVLHNCPNLTVVATSRERLAIAGEQVMPLRPLDVDAASRPAIDLFIARAGAVRPDYDASLEADSIAGICRRLDGIPLAIEMAAARVRTFTAAEIEERLDARYSLLRNPYRSPAARHQSLRQVFEWSYDLLAAEEQALFATLAVFAGDFGIEAAEAVVRTQPHARPVADVLEDLVDRSLVEVDHRSTGTRYRVLETLRAFGDEQLRNSGRHDEISRCHAEYFVARADEAARGIQGPDESRWTELIEREVDNLRAAYQWSLAGHQDDLVLRLVAAVFPIGYNRAAREFLEWGQQAAAECTSPHPLLPIAHAAAGVLAVSRGDLAAARRHADIAVADPMLPGAARGFGLLADLALVEGDTAAVQRMTDRYRQLATTAGDHHAVADALVSRAVSCAYAGDLAGGVQACTELRAVADALGNPTQLAWTDFAEGEVLLDTDPARAASCLERAVATARAVDARFVEAIAGLSLASLRARHGEPVEALRDFKANILLWESLGDRSRLMVAIRNLLILLPQLGAMREGAVLLGGVRRAETSAAYGMEEERLAALHDDLSSSLATEFASAYASGEQMSPVAVIDFALDVIDRLVTG
jgi:predicted ATPase